ncbi:hypothetical protein K439DRAFT_1397523 [Ramaria rubella]|nr:hypothetical protein K439DRAFT_1397523 [Ramaria rubella]
MPLPLPQTTVRSDWRSLRRYMRTIPKICRKHFSIPPVSHERDNGRYEDFYRCSTKRWLYNEEKQLALRYVRFDVLALQSVAAKACGAKKCVSMVKTAEGSFNKVFTLRFDNGTEAIARIPCPIAGPTHLTVASEVATLDFVRTRLKIPVPKVLAWSFSGNESNVGAEYIIMEKVDGVPLSDRWLEVTGEDFMSFIEKIINYERSFSGVRFSQIGSLYYKEDVAPELQTRRLYARDVPDDEASDKFRIGPTLQREFWRGERIDMDIDRGPWPDSLSYGSAIVKCEQKWLKIYAHPRALGHPLRFSADEEDPEIHVRMLDRFESVVPYIIRDSDFFYHTLWHTDLHDSNIMVHPDGFPEIIGIIDWQEWIGPRFLRAVFPRLLSYEGDMIDLGAAKPSLPEDFEELSEEQKDEARLQLRLAARHRVYQYYMRKNDPSHYKVLSYRHLRTLFTLFRNASRTWTDGVVPLRQALIEVADNWSDLAGPDVPCPLIFSDAELRSHATLMERMQRHENRTRIIHEVLKLEPDGVVEPERYEAMKEAVERVRKVWDDERDGGAWPLQDGAWSSLL